MSMRDFRFIYGPVASWRLGSSLGIDPLSQKNILCSFDCTYCQLGTNRSKTDRIAEYVKTEDVVDEINSLPESRVDYITFSGRGEPSLAANLGDMIDAVRGIRKEKICVITNSSLLYRQDVRHTLVKADLVLAKLDAFSQEMFEKINRPLENLSFFLLLEGLRLFRSEFKGKLALQMMFTRDNRNTSGELAKLAEELDPDEVQINTPTRPCREEALPRNEIRGIKRNFSGFNAVSVYESGTGRVVPISSENTLRRRGKI